jgi:hypothetical protein
MSTGPLVATLTRTCVYRSVLVSSGSGSFVVRSLNFPVVGALLGATEDLALLPFLRPTPRRSMLGFPFALTEICVWRGKLRNEKAAAATSTLTSQSDGQGNLHLG